MAEKSSTIGVRMPDKLISFLKKEAREQAYKKDKNISFSKLIREAVEEKYPEKRWEK